jgi:hypothetical protein
MQFKGNSITADVTDSRYNLRKSLAVCWAANILITIAVLIFLKLAALLYKNVEKLNAQYLAQAWFTVFKMNPFYNNKKYKQWTGVFGYCAE